MAECESSGAAAPASKRRRDDEEPNDKYECMKTRALIFRQNAEIMFYETD
jgi:hypothetical protein